MPLAGIVNIPNDQDSLSRWSFNYQAWVRDVNAAVLRQYGVRLPEYALDPIPTDPPEAAGVWLYSNQSWHNERNSVLGIQGQDLADVDLTDVEQRAAWIGLVFAEEYQAAQILGLG